MKAKKGLCYLNLRTNSYSLPSHPKKQIVIILKQQNVLKLQGGGRGGGWNLGEKMMRPREEQEKKNCDAEKSKEESVSGKVQI